MSVYAKSMLGMVLLKDKSQAKKLKMVIKWNILITGYVMVIHGK